MPTPLFPKSGPITMKQGQTGDCYLLASLDCILTSGEDGRKKIESLFKETKQGVEVRIKKGTIFDDLQLEKLRGKGETEGKYTFSYDNEREEDVILVSPKQLETIDNTPGGVESNSLAIKILEHLSSYYYAEDWPYDRSTASEVAYSVAAHKCPKRYEGTPTAFVGQLLNIRILDIPTQLDLGTILKLKMMDPSYPVYISINWGQQDAFGRYHAQHALRLSHIQGDPKKPETCTFFLVNPWDNSVTTRPYSFQELQRKNYQLCAFNVHREYTNLLLEESRADGVLRIDAFSKSIFVFFYEFIPSVHEFSFKELLKRTNANPDAFLTEFLELVNLIIHDKSVDIIQKNNFLIRLINFALNQSEINFRILKAVAECARQYTLSHPSELLTIGANILNKSLDKAWDERKLEVDKARSDIEKQELIRYYFSEDPKVLTSAGGVRQLFAEGICSKLEIERLSEYGSLGVGIKDAALQYGIARILKNSEITPWNRNIIQKFSFYLGARHYQFILEEADWKKIDPRILFERLYVLSQLNPKLAMVLYHYAAEFFQRTYKMDFAPFAESIREGNESEFKTWFLHTLSLQSQYRQIKEATDFLKDCAKQIKAFSISYEDMSNEAGVKKREAEMSAQLDGMVRNLQINQALQILGLDGLPKDIIVSLRDKRKELKMSLDEHLQKVRVQEAEILIAQYRERITTFSIDFSMVHKTETINQRRIHLLSELNTLLTQPDLSRALSFLPSQKEVIEREISCKAEEIRKVADECIHNVLSKFLSDLGQVESHIMELCEKMPTIPSLYELVPPTVKEPYFGKTLHRANGNPDVFLTTFLELAKKFILQSRESARTKHKFLGKLIDFAFDQSEINFKILKSVSRCIQQYNLINPDQPLTISVHILKKSLEKAFHERGLVLGERSGKKEVLGELAHYYFWKKHEDLMPTGGLRQLFQEGICSMRDIESINDTSSVVHYGSAAILKNIEMSPWSEKIIRTSPANLAPENCKYILRIACWEKMNPSALLKQLHVLSQFNPKFAAALLHYVAQSFKDTYQRDFASFVQDMREEKDIGFKTWFLDVLKSKASGATNPAASPSPQESHRRQRELPNPSMASGPGLFSSQTDPRKTLSSQPSDSSLPRPS